MQQALRAGRWSGYIRTDVDLPTVADRMVQSMLHVGLDVIRHKASSDQVATLLSTMILEGSGRRVADGRGARRVCRVRGGAGRHPHVGSTKRQTNSDAKAVHLRAVARAEFGRRGYEMTTIRDIASAAGLGTGTVYRVIGSKDELLMSIMLDFGKKVGGAWSDILALGFLHAREAGRIELAEHQRSRPVPRRVPDPTRVDATVTARYAGPGVVVHDTGCVR